MKTAFFKKRAILILILICAACATPKTPGAGRQASSPMPPGTATLSPAQLEATQGAVVQATRRVQATLDEQSTAESQRVTATAAQQLTQEAAEIALAKLKAQKLEAAQADWQAALSDPFTSNDLGWPLGQQEDDTMVIQTQIDGGKFLWTVVEAMHGSSFWNLIPAKGKTFQDFYVKLNLEIVRDPQGGSYAYGLVFHHFNDDYGFFGLRGDGRFQVLAVFDKSIYQDIVLRSDAILTDQPNQIGVRGLGSEYVFLINGQPVWYMEEDFSPGEIGLGVEVMVKGGEAQVAFTDLEVAAP